MTLIARVRRRLCYNAPMRRAVLILAGVVLALVMAAMLVAALNLLR
jgi:hypothetical protein